MLDWHQRHQISASAPLQMGGFQKKCLGGGLLCTSLICALRSTELLAGLLTRPGHKMFPHKCQKSAAPEKCQNMGVSAPISRTRPFPYMATDGVQLLPPFRHQPCCTGLKEFGA